MTSAYNEQLQGQFLWITNELVLPTIIAQSNVSGRHEVKKPWYVHFLFQPPDKVKVPSNLTTYRANDMPSPQAALNNKIKQGAIALPFWLWHADDLDIIKFASHIYYIFGAEKVVRFDLSRIGMQCNNHWCRCRREVHHLRPLKRNSRPYHLILMATRLMQRQYDRCLLEGTNFGSFMNSAHRTGSQSWADTATNISRQRQVQEERVVCGNFLAPKWWLVLKLLVTTKPHRLAALYLHRPIQECWTRLNSTNPWMSLKKLHISRGSQRKKKA